MTEDQQDRRKGQRQKKKVKPSEIKKSHICGRKKQIGQEQEIRSGRKAALCSWKKLSGWDWAILLGEQPQFAGKRK